MAGCLSRCFAYYGPGDVRLETRKLVCGPTDIMLRIAVCGRCGTDRRLWDTPHPGVKTPTVLGHEFVGRVVEVGDRVRSLTQGIAYKAGQALNAEALSPAIGQRVTVQSRVARHRDGLMLMRDPVENLTFNIPGAYAQYMIVPAQMIQGGALLPIPDTVADEEAALVEPAACALESIFSTPHPTGVDAEGRHVFRGGIRSGGRTLIVGSGTLAMIYGRLAKIEGAKEVWFVVRSQAKVELANTVLGDWPHFEVIPDYSSLEINEKLKHEEKLAEKFADLTGGNLFDDIVLACPSKDAQRLMFQLLNPDGYGVVACFAGLHDRSEETRIDNLHYRIGKAIGTSGCSTRTMETVLQWIANGKLSLKGFTCPTHYTLDNDPEEFFQTRADGRKPMLYPWE